MLVFLVQKAVPSFASAGRYIVVFVGFRKRSDILSKSVVVV